MVMTAEYGTVELAKADTLKVARGKGHAAVLLQFRPAGWTVAGSAARWRERDLWAATVYVDGAFHGREYRDRAEAEAHYARLVEFYDAV